MRSWKLLQFIFELTRVFKHYALLLFEEEFYLFEISRILSYQGLSYQESTLFLSEVFTGWNNLRTLNTLKNKENRNKHKKVYVSNSLYATLIFSKNPSFLKKIWKYATVYIQAGSREEMRGFFTPAYNFLGFIF